MASLDIEDNPAMFCYQCEQTKTTSNGRGCTKIGVCGKTAHVSNIQDLLIHCCVGLGVYAHRAHEIGVNVNSNEISDCLMEALFATVTNVNFDAARFPKWINEAIAQRDQLRTQYETKCKQMNIQPFDPTNTAAAYQLPKGAENDLHILEQEGKKVGVLSKLENYGESVEGVRELVIFGLKGLAAYYCHANQLGQRDVAVEYGAYQTLNFLETAEDAKRKDLVANFEHALKMGELNLRVMQLLDKGHNEAFGTPSPHMVNDFPTQGKCILVSGHDMVDIERILRYTEKRNINVYTHGEMLPAHSYPKLRAYKNLVGHFGGGWQRQQLEFPKFPGAIVVTTNCIIEPKKSYADRTFTLNAVGWPGTRHLDTTNENSLQELVDCALSQNGFTADDVAAADKTKHIQVGFGHSAILGHAQTVVNAVKSGALKRVFLVGGCDGSEPGRNYFSDLVNDLPDTTLVLTLGCAKYRFNRLRDFGTLGDSGIPRLLDMGQCNDAYGAVQVALALANAFNTDVNALPLSLCLSWFEQKAVAVLLTLLHLGIRNIHIGPVMPAFITDQVLDILIDKYNIIPVDLSRRRDPTEDIDLMMDPTVTDY